MDSRKKIIAIDGPAGSGKSTTARLVAHRLGFIFLDTGAMYRVVALLALEKKLSCREPEKLGEIAQTIRIEFREGAAGQQVFADGRNVSELIRSPEVTAAVSQVSAHAVVRQFMVAKQREMGRLYNLVAEGRDTTSIVFPEATLKIYLLASLETRARRRVLDFERMGKKTTLEEQIRLLEDRDRYDSGRAVSPLIQTHDAIVVDTTDLTIDMQVEKILELYRQKTSR